LSSISALCLVLCFLLEENHEDLYCLLLFIADSAAVLCKVMHIKTGWQLQIESCKYAGFLLVTDSISHACL